VPSSVRDLGSGEVVAFSHQNQPFIVRQDSIEQDFIFLCELGRPGDEPAAIEVLKDPAGSCFGFRVTAAEGRFLQANHKRQPQSRRLLFFNHNFGTNEQWELDNLPHTGWTQASLHFRHRRFTVRKLAALIRA
jgi:hypothetical protein